MCATRHATKPVPIVARWHNVPTGCQNRPFSDLQDRATRKTGDTKAWDLEDLLARIFDPSASKASAKHLVCAWPIYRQTFQFTVTTTPSTATSAWPIYYRTFQSTATTTPTAATTTTSAWPMYYQTFQSTATTTRTTAASA